MTKVRVIANKVKNTAYEQFIRENIPEDELLGFVHYNAEVMDADRNGASPYDFSKTVKNEIRK